MPPAHPCLMFAGLVQPIGPTIPLVETQGKWIAALLSGAFSLPSVDEMEKEISDHLARQKRTFLESERYVLEVDSRHYSGQMNSDMRS